MKLFKYASMMLAMLAAVSFVSCGDDEDEDEEGSENATNISINKKDLYGVWEPIYMKATGEDEEGKFSDEGKITNGWPEFWGKDDRDEDSSEEDGFLRVEFLENGIINGYYYMKGQWLLDDLSCTYKLSGNDITVSENGVDYDYTYKITKLNNTTLVLEMTHEEKEGDTIYKYWEQTTYKKIK